MNILLESMNMAMSRVIIAPKKVINLRIEKGRYFM
jgi:hypothetical protein